MSLLINVMKQQASMSIILYTNPTEIEELFEMHSIWQVKIWCFTSKYCIHPYVTPLSVMHKEQKLPWQNYWVQERVVENLTHTEMPNSVLVALLLTILLIKNTRKWYKAHSKDTCVA